MSTSWFLVPHAQDFLSFIHLSTSSSTADPTDDVHDESGWRKAEKGVGWGNRCGNSQERSLRKDVRILLSVKPA